MQLPPAVVPGPRPWAYVLLLVSLGAGLNYYDRYLIAILIQPIKVEMGLTDSQVGLMTGLAFASVYSAAAIPIARIADRGKRVYVLTGALAFWSLMTGFTALATGFGTLLICRLGVAVGEAGGLPSSHALVAEYVPQHRRASALAFVAFMSAIGTSAAMIFGGIIADAVSWRGAFVAAAVPGILLAIVIGASIREPRASTAGAGEASMRFGSAVATLWQRKSFRFFCIGTGFGIIEVFAFQIWAPAFVMRTFALSAGEVGRGYSLVFTVGTLAATIVGGLLFDRLYRRDARWALWMQATSYTAALPLGMLWLFAPSYTVMMLTTPFFVFVNGLYATPAYALVQALSGPRLRSTAAAIFMVVANLVGFGIGPWLTGALSDALGAHGLRSALAIILITGPFGAVFLLWGARTLRADLAIAERGVAS